MPEITRMQGLIAATGLGFALFACESDPPASDLDTEGPPRVITVTVLSEFAQANLDIADIATYCGDAETDRLNANYCPPPVFDDVPADMLAAAPPIDWEVRLVFNELLDPSVETLLSCRDMNHDGACTDVDEDGEGLSYGSLVATQPVTLTCGGMEIPYDGYYQPAGNHLTIPPGPSLVIQPIFPDAFAATGETCEVTVRSQVQGKDDEGVTNGGPFTFKIAAMDVVQTVPAEGASIAVGASLEVRFNAYVDEASLADAVTVTDADGNDVPVTVMVNPTGNSIAITPMSGSWAADTNYTLTIAAGVQDIGGGAYGGSITLNFNTNTP